MIRREDVPLAALQLAGIAIVLAVATGEGWPLGTWADRVSPVPLFAGAGLFAFALVGGLHDRPQADGREEPPGGRLLPAARVLGAPAVAAGVALLGGSGHALLLSAAFVAANVWVFRMSGAAASPQPQAEFQEASTRHPNSS